MDTSLIRFISMIVAVLGILLVAALAVVPTVMDAPVRVRQRHARRN